MRFSKAFIKTYKEAPKEAEVISHKLMLRASMIKQLTRGVYSYLPLGNKVLRKVENIVREEMDKSGAQEIHMPVMQPADLWKESGRWYAYGTELMRLKDRNQRDFALGPTHEEVITDIIRNTIDSYKSLPINLYQIQTKFRDEMRPRFGLMRSREFLMKDAYSFHITEKSLDEEYKNMRQTYINIFERCGLDFRIVEADSGSIGGDVTNEFMVLAESGEDDIFYCDTCDYSANGEKATSVIDLDIHSEEKREKKVVDTPETKTIEEVSKFLNVDINKTLKSVLFKEVLEDEIKYYLALIRGDLDVNEVKLKNVVDATMELEMIDDEDCKTLGITKGFVGAIGINKDIKVVIDESVTKMINFVTGANEVDKHIVDANLDDFDYSVIGDIRQVRAGEKCPKCGGTLKVARGIEVGHIFKLGTKYSESMKANILDDNGRQKSIIMGCYGIGVSRIIAAAIEQNFDDNGIVWSKTLAPYLVDVIIANIKDSEQVEVAEKLYNSFREKGIDVLLDDRNERAGFKFKDADLIGIPFKVIVGKTITDGKVEVKDRATGKSKEIEIDKVVNYILSN